MLAVNEIDKEALSEQNHGSLMVRRGCALLLSSSVLYAGRTILRIAMAWEEPEPRHGGLPQT